MNGSEDPILIGNHKTEKCRWHIYFLNSGNNMEGAQAPQWIQNAVKRIEFVVQRARGVYAYSNGSSSSLT